jgi:hypothetical protein
VNYIYNRRFIVSSKYILNFIALAESFEERHLIRGFSIHYDTTNRVFTSVVDFQSGEDFRLFHNIAVQFMAGIRVEDM